MAKPKKPTEHTVRSYQHPEAKVASRPEIGTQAQFRKKKEAATFRYDSSLAPTMSWDAQNGSRELGEWLLKQADDAIKLDPPHEFDKPRPFKDSSGQDVVAVSSLAEVIQALKKLGTPFLEWAGKAERLSFDVPTLPLFVHERLSTEAILDTIKSHETDTRQSFDLFNDPKHSITDQVLRAYEHKDDWVNRLILGDSLVIMNSLVRYEGMGGQVQTVYIDPPYGVKYGSNFQPFIRNRDVKNNDDKDLTREPEVVRAYRDTWELGLHSYLTYLRDRLLLTRELLTDSGSVFVQISDENVHHVREVMDEIFGPENFVSLITFKKTSGAGSPSIGTEVVASVSDYIIWYAKDKERVKYRQLYIQKKVEKGELGAYTWLELPDGTRRRMTPEEKGDLDSIPKGAKIFRAGPLTSQTAGKTTQFPFEFEGKMLEPGKGGWKTNLEGMNRLKDEKRLILLGNTLSYVRYLDDFPVNSLSNLWEDTVIAGFADPKTYAVQTTTKAVQRCILMTTDPGDLVLDPTCGSGTTAYASEQWGRRWITIDTSRVPLALTRQRLLTATYPYYALREPDRGPAGGFAYERKQNRKGEEVGGLVPHVTLKSIVNQETGAEEVLVDKPEVTKSITRVSGPFAVEATIPTPVDWEGDGVEDTTAEVAEEYGSHVERMIEVLRQSPVLHLEGNKSVTLSQLRPPAKSLTLSAEAIVENGSDKQIAIVFGPENGAVSEKLVFEAAREANAQGYSHLYVIGFAIQPAAREFVENADKVAGIPATYVQATPDLLMGDLLKNMRSSQIFSVSGLPEVDVRKRKDGRYEVELVGLDSFDPTTMQTEHSSGDDVPIWMLDGDYNGLVFHASQVFFPRTSAWNALRKAVKGIYDEEAWEHLAGTISAPFAAGDEKTVAVKVVDDRGNELLVTKKLPE